MNIFKSLSFTFILTNINICFGFSQTSETDSFNETDYEIIWNADTQQSSLISTKSAQTAKAEFKTKLPELLRQALNAANSNNLTNNKTNHKLPTASTNTRAKLKTSETNIISKFKSKFIELVIKYLNEENINTSTQQIQNFINTLLKQIQGSLNIETLQKLINKLPKILEETEGIINIINQIFKN